MSAGDTQVPESNLLFITHLISVLSILHCNWTWFDLVSSYTSSVCTIYLMNVIGCFAS
jgi:hypothetical protein